MRYNNALAVGLSIGLPCALVFVGCLVLWIRNRKRQKVEDQSEEAIDVELRDENSFSKFEDALHRPYDNKKDLDTAAHEKRVSSTDVASTLLRFTSSSNTYDHKKVYLPPGSSVADSHRKTASAYDFYDTFIPILPSSNNNITHSSRNSTSELPQPPPLAAHADRASSHSNSDASLIDNNTSSRSLDNFAKQLLGPLFFEKLPSRAATVSLKQRNLAENHNSLSDFVPADLLQNANMVNENFVYTPETPKKHPYAERLASKPAAAGHTLENNFDNNIAADANFGEEAGVVFK